MPLAARVLEATRSELSRSRVARESAKSLSFLGQKRKSPPQAAGYSILTSRRSEPKVRSRRLQD